MFWLFVGCIGVLACSEYWSAGVLERRICNGKLQISEIAEISDLCGLLSGERRGHNELLVGRRQLHLDSNCQPQPSGWQNSFTLFQLFILC